ncbi:uncharacterized protein LOC135825754 [Sycon ciliatum]|uniref:uncharacterized protein LOC135825754 n=1 Tax=Sycon ciliatum TaxID=27933 RepID=UPI0031F6C077
MLSLLLRLLIASWHVHHFLVPIVSSRPVYAGLDSREATMILQHSSTAPFDREWSLSSSTHPSGTEVLETESDFAHTPWKLESVLRWSAENRRARANPARGLDVNQQSRNIVCLPRTNVCCNRESRTNSAYDADNEDDAFSPPAAGASAAAARTDCVRLVSCRTQFCSGTAPLSCLLGAGYHGRPTITYASHLPLAKLQRQAGYGVGIDRGFSTSDTVSGGRNVGRRAGSEEHAWRGIATTDLTDLRFNLALLKTAQYRVGRFLAVLRVGGTADVCRRYRARLQVRVLIRARHGAAIYRSHVARELRFDDATTVPLNLSMGCSHDSGHGNHGNRASACRLHLETTLRTTPPTARAALRRYCWVRWENARLTVAPPDEPCSDVCSDAVPLACLAKRNEIGGTGSHQVSQYTLIKGGGTERVNRPQDRGQAGTFESQRQGLLATGAFSSTDIFLPVTPSGHRSKFNLQVAERDWAIMSGHLAYITPHGDQLEACSNLTGGQGAKVAVTFSIGKQDLLSRTLRVSAAHGTQWDIGPFVIVPATIVDGVRPRRQLTISVRLISMAKRARATTGGDMHCGVVAMANARVSPAEGPLQFASCQHDCYNVMAEARLVPLSCFLGKMRTKNRGFACSGSVTKRSNPFIAIATSFPGTRIGVDRAGKWKQHVPVVLNMPSASNAMAMNASENSLQQQQNRALPRTLRVERLIGAYPESRLDVNLTAFRASGQRFTHFTTTVGLDASSCQPREMTGVQFRVLLDGRLNYSASVNHAWASREIVIDVRDSLQMSLVTLKLHRTSVLLTCTPAVWAEPVLRYLQESNST